MAWRLGELSGRVAATVSANTDAQAGQRFGDRVEASIDLNEKFPTDPVLARFPITKQGYACDVVDQYMDEVQAALGESRRELAELRGQLHSATSIAAEIERLGEQTAAILITAHDKAYDTVRRAQVDAGTCVADAASYAAALREEANLERRRAEAETTSLRDERARLIEEIQNTAAALSSLATNAATR